MFINGHLFLSRATPECPSLLPIYLIVNARYVKPPDDSLEYHRMNHVVNVYTPYTAHQHLQCNRSILVIRVYDPGCIQARIKPYT